MKASNATDLLALRGYFILCDFHLNKLFLRNDGHGLGSVVGGEHATLDLGVMRSGPKSGTDFTKKQKEGFSGCSYTEILSGKQKHDVYSRRRTLRYKKCCTGG